MNGTKRDMLPPDNVIQKIQKLLALTQNPNEHEAALAAEKAMELVTKYNLDMAQIAVETGEKGSPVEHDTFPMGERSSIAWSWMVNIGMAVGRACYCKTLFHERRRNLTYIGKPANIVLAKTLYRFLQGQMLIMAESASRAPGQYMHRSRFKSSWLLGASEKVNIRLQEKRLQEEAENCQTTALVVSTAAENNAYCDNEFDTVESKYKYDPAKKALMQGYRDGDHITLEQERELPSATVQLGG